MSRFWNIRNGDLLAFRSRGLIARLIQLRTLSRVSHVGLAYWFHDQLTIIEAVEGRGIRIFPIERYFADRPNLWIDHYALNSDCYGIDRDEMIRWARKQWGKRYAPLWQFVRSYFPLSERVLDYFGVPKDIDKERFYCSEFVVNALFAGGLVYDLDIEPADSSPGDVLEMTCYSRRGRLEL